MVNKIKENIVFSIFQLIGSITVLAFVVVHLYNDISLLLNR